MASSPQMLPLMRFRIHIFSDFQKFQILKWMREAADLVLAAGRDPDMRVAWELYDILRESWCHQSRVSWFLPLTSLIIYLWGNLSEIEKLHICAQSNCLFGDVRLRQKLRGSPHSVAHFVFILYLVLQYLLAAFDFSTRACVCVSEKYQTLFGDYM